MGGCIGKARNYRVKEAPINREKYQNIIPKTRGSFANPLSFRVNYINRKAKSITKELHNGGGEK